MGGAGVAGGCYTIIAFIVRPAKVPAYMGMTGAVFGVASVAGPLLGGVLTEKVTWRWWCVESWECVSIMLLLMKDSFYINLPIGGATMLVLIFFYHTPAHVKPASSTMKELLFSFDFLGILIMMASLICFCLALEWGGIIKAWDSSDVIGTLVGFVVLAILWAAIEWKQKERALVVPRILKDRPIAACAAFLLW
jgi:MFS family permease